jgi:hypothetical protein
VLCTDAGVLGLQARLDLRAELSALARGEVLGVGELPNHAALLVRTLRGNVGFLDVLDRAGAQAACSHVPVGVLQILRDSALDVGHFGRRVDGHVRRLQVDVPQVLVPVGVLRDSVADVLAGEVRVRRRGRRDRYGGVVRVVRVVPDVTCVDRRGLPRCDELAGALGLVPHSELGRRRRQ